jgi:hypothetical protein
MFRAGGDGGRGKGLISDAQNRVKEVDWLARRADSLIFGLRTLIRKTTLGIGSQDGTRSGDLSISGTRRKLA